MRLTFNRVWLAYDVFITLALIACAAFIADDDWWVRLDGWLAIGTGLATVLQWHEVEKENKGVHHAR